MARRLTALLLVALAGCSTLKIEGECIVVREVKTTYHCPADGRIEHRRLAPIDPQ
jgi:hypothetical protein